MLLQRTLQRVIFRPQVVLHPPKNHSSFLRSYATPPSDNKNLTFVDLENAFDTDTSGRLPIYNEEERWTVRIEGLSAELNDDLLRTYLQHTVEVGKDERGYTSVRMQKGTAIATTFDLELAVRTLQTFIGRSATGKRLTAEIDCLKEVLVTNLPETTTGPELVKFLVPKHVIRNVRDYCLPVAFAEADPPYAFVKLQTGNVAAHLVSRFRGPETPSTMYRGKKLGVKPLTLGSDVFLYNVPSWLTKEELTSWASEFGRVTLVHVPRTLGQAYLRMSTRDEAAAVKVGLHGKDCTKGTRLAVETFDSLEALVGKRTFGKRVSHFANRKGTIYWRPDVPWLPKTCAPRRFKRREGDRE